MRIRVAGGGCYSSLEAVVKPPQFRYHDPITVDEATSLLAEYGEDAKVLAGGQSLVPLLNFRLAAPEHVVDINGLVDLDYLRSDDSGLHIGALTRHTAVEKSIVVASGWPLLHEAIGWVAHPQIRNRGTVGGSVAHADPAAEIPVILAALDAHVTLRSASGTRTLHWSELFVTHLTTSLNPDELLVSIDIPPEPAGSGSAFVEYARRNGDFALGGAAAIVSLSPDGECTGASLALLAAAATPVRSTEAETVLIGTRVDDSTVREAAQAAVGTISPPTDIHGSADYRIHLLESLVRRAVTCARDRAKERFNGHP